MTIFFVQGLGRTGVSGENVSAPTTGLPKGKQWSGAFVGEKKQRFFLNEPIAGTSRRIYL